jgi:hypothetical protein
LSQLRVAAAHPEPAAPRPAWPSETGQAVAVSALLTVAWHLVTPLGRPGRDAVYYWRTYLLLTLGCLVASGPLVYLLCRRLGAAHWSAMAAIAGPWCSRGWAFFVADGQLTLNHSGQALAFTVILMTLTALALWWPRLPVRHG